MAQARRQQIQMWIGRGAWTIIDQGLFAISNFSLSIVLARWLDIEDYGSFSIAFSIFLFLGVVFNALMIEPMMVYGSGKYVGCFRGYLSKLLKLHWLVLYWVIGLAGMFVAMFYITTSSFVPLLYLSLFSGLIFYQWLMRRACYVVMKPHIAAIGGMWYFAVMIGGIAAFRAMDRLNTVTGIFMMALSSVVAAVWIHRNLFKNREVSESVDEKKIIKDHWEYGKWALSSNILSWFPSNIYFLILPLWVGASAPGELRVVFNFAMPMLQLVGAFGPILIPVLVNSFNQGTMRRTVRILAFVVTGVTLVYAAGLKLCGQWIMELAYNGKYLEYTERLWLIGILPLFAALVLVFGTAIRAMQKPKLIFKAYVGVTILCVIIGLPMTYLYGVNGAIFGLIVASVGNSIIMGVLYIREINNAVKLV